MRGVVSFCEIGGGHESIQTFSRCMNMFSFGQPCYRNINESLFVAYEESALANMSRACAEAKQKCTECQSDPSIHVYCKCRVSLDGAWQKRGYSSFNDVVIAVSDGKRLDSHVLSKRKQCRIWERGKDTDDLWTGRHGLI